MTLCNKDMRCGHFCGRVEHHAYVCDCQHETCPESIYSQDERRPEDMRAATISAPATARWLVSDGFGGWELVQAASDLEAVKRYTEKRGKMLRPDVSEFVVVEVAQMTTVRLAMRPVYETAVV